MDVWLNRCEVQKTFKSDTSLLVWISHDSQRSTLSLRPLSKTIEAILFSTNFPYICEMKRTILFVFCLAFLLPTFSYAQRIYQLSGLVISENGQEPLPFVTVRVNHTRRGAVSNGDGFYSIPVSQYDTVYFSHVGYHMTKFVVGDYLRDYRRENATYIYAIHYLLEDTLTLPEVMIFPYDTPEELKTAILNMEAQGTPEAIARANLSPDVIDAIIQTLPVDGEERLMVGRQMYYEYYQNRQLLPNASLDPVAAMRLLQYVAEKARRKRDKDLNYWED
jgi:hypothetical protein